MRLLVFLGHPAHYHLFKNILPVLKARGHEVDILIVTKDILEELVLKSGWEYENILPEGRRHSRLPAFFSTAVGVWKTFVRVLCRVRKRKYHLLVGTEYTLVYAGAFLGVQSLLLHEDDTAATPEKYLFYPFATRVLMPECCDRGKWQSKRIPYRGYHELAYLAPAYFQARPGIAEPLKRNGRYFIVRLAQLTASHDVGIRGLDDQLVRRIVERLSPFGAVYLTAERPLPDDLEPLRLRTNPLDIFDILYYADLYIGDSQTMAAEAAVLGTPSIRYNGFAGRLSYLNELEGRYQLTFGIRPGREEPLMERIDQLLNIPDLKEVWQQRRRRMLDEQADVVRFISDTVCGLAESSGRKRGA